MRKFILSLILTIWALPAFATQYYINYGTGSDSNNGTSTGTPFNTCSPIEGANFLKAADTASIFYTNHFVSTDAHCNIASAGNPANHITINTYGGSTTSTGLTITVTVSSGVITGGSIAAAGTGYSAGQIVNVGSLTSPGSGNGGQFTVASVSSGVPQTITLLNGGQLYTAATFATYNPMPIFDGSVAPSSIVGFTGWILNSAQYNFTIPSSTILANSVYQTPNGNQFTVTANITSQTTLVANGVGAPNAASSTLTLVSGTGPSPITYTATSTLATIYATNVVVPFAVSNVNIDGSYSLRRMNSSGGQTVASMLTKYNSYFQSASGQVLYVELSDTTNPTAHTVSLGQYGPSSRGIVQADSTYSSYVDFYNLIVQDAFNMGITSGAPYVTFNNVVGQFNGREGIYFYRNSAVNGVGAAYDKCIGCVSQYNNGYFTGSAGQGVTIEAPHVDFISGTVQFNWMAGIDMLNYPSSPQTSPIDDRIINTYEHNNSMRAWQNDPGGFDPVCIYGDGASNIQIINNVCVQDGVLASTTTANAVASINIGNEHPSLYPINNIDLINSLIIGGDWIDFEVDAINCSGAACQIANNIRIIGDTFSGGQYAWSFPGMAQGGFLYMFNNIFNKNAGSAFGVTPGYGTGGAPTGWTAVMNNNTYYNPGLGSSHIMDTSFLTGAVSFSAWQSLSGNDAAGQYSNPLLVTGPSAPPISNAYYLSSTSSGQGSNSPVLAFAVPNYLGSQYVFSSIGTVLTNQTVDSTSTPAGGYHYNAVFTSSTFPSTQVGSDIGPNAY